jgi:hypothetical protein
MSIPNLRVNSLLYERRIVMSRLVLIAMASLVFVAGAFGQIDVGSDGSDGAFAPVSSVTIDLAQADTGPGSGHYDPDRWAVIFNYTSVNIPGGVNVDFSNHPSGAPVVWLVQGDVTIDGAVVLDGENQTGSATRPSIPGPGGFRGGRQYISTQSEGGGGFGPGGADYEYAGNHGSSGSHATLGEGGSEGPTYGNEQIIPLIGGSGGESHRGSSGFAGGAGGGAILIAAGGTITVNGQISAAGGHGRFVCCWTYSGAGSGGAIRLVANEVAGAGQLLAFGGGGGGNGRVGGFGRVRVESNVVSPDLISNPAYSFSTPELDRRCLGGDLDNSPCAADGDCLGGGTCSAAADVPLLWPPDDSPRLVATKFVVDPLGSPIDVPIPADPHAELDFPNEDISLDSVDDLELHIEAYNVPLDWVVEVHVTAKSGRSFRVTAEPLVGTQQASTTTATFSMERGFSAVQLRAYAPTP